MLKAILCSLTILFFIPASGQNKKSIEVSLVGRYDRHADYISNFAGRAYNDTNKLYGKSYGANVTYRQQITKSISVSLGAGYYRLGIDKIKGSMPFSIPGTRTARSINYDDGMTNLLYSTSKYYYNNFAITFGLTKTFPLKETLYLDIGAEGVGYYSFSQRYRLFDGPKHYLTTNAKPLEFGANATFGILKQYKKFYILPALLIPIYQNLKGDKVFYEDRHMNISKWFDGIGLTLRVGKYINIVIIDIKFKVYDAILHSSIEFLIVLLLLIPYGKHLKTFFWDMAGKFGKPSNYGSKLKTIIIPMSFAIIATIFGFVSLKVWVPEKSKLAGVYNISGIIVQNDTLQLKTGKYGKVPTLFFEYFGQSIFSLNDTLYSGNYLQKADSITINLKTGFNGIKTVNGKFDKDYKLIKGVTDQNDTIEISINRIPDSEMAYH